MANNKVQLADGTTLIDLTSDTVTPQTMLAGTTAHAASGEQITGVVNLANAGDAVPLADSGSGAVGSSTDYAREDHIHPLSKALGIPIVDTDANSTATNFIVTVSEYSAKNAPENGMVFFLRNTAINSATGCTLNVNGWGALPIYSSSSSRVEDGLALNRIYPCYYHSSLVEGGCWVIGYLFDTATSGAANVLPLADNASGAIGNSLRFARQDHVHPFGPAIEVPTATVDPNSTATNFIVQVPQFAHKSGPEDGMFFIVYNDVVKSQAGCTLNVNGWGAKPMYNAKKEVIQSGFSLTFFPVWYNSTFVPGGCWIIGYLYDTTVIPSPVQTPHQDEVAGAIGISSGYAREDHIHPINKNAVKQDNYNLFVGTITNTIKTVSLASGRKISDFNILFASVINASGWQRASAIIFGARFANGENISMIDVNSVNTQTWFEISYVDDTHIKIQSSANGSGATIALYGLGSGILYS